MLSFSILQIISLKLHIFGRSTPSSVASAVPSSLVIVGNPETRGWCGLNIVHNKFRENRSKLRRGTHGQAAW
jgi:hypothetical protein